MRQDRLRTVEERRTSQDRVFRIALGVSVLFHVFVFFIWRTIPLPPTPLTAPGPRARALRAAGGGMRARTRQVPPPPPNIPPRVPLLTMAM
ncbi:MAG: hypothetical protein ABIF09_01945, partial [Gemmatimonadota bacterium]